MPDHVFPFPSCWVEGELSCWSPLTPPLFCSSHPDSLTETQFLAWVVGGFLRPKFPWKPFSLLINNISHRPICSWVSEKTWHGRHVSSQACSCPEFDSVNLLQITSFHLYARLLSQNLNLNSVFWFWRASHPFQHVDLNVLSGKCCKIHMDLFCHHQHCSSYPTVKCCQIRRAVFYCPPAYSNWQHCTIPWFMFNLIYGC